MALTDAWLKANFGKERAALAERSDREGVRITPEGKITFQLRYRYDGKPRKMIAQAFRPCVRLKLAVWKVSLMVTSLFQGCSGSTVARL